MNTLATLEVPEITNDSVGEESGFGCLETAKGVLPLKAMDVKSAITDLAYTVTLSQTFVNAFDQPLEATYIFPLPSRAAVSKFRFKVKDKVIDGVLKERNEARREYQQAIQAGHRAALAEEDRPSTFSMKVGNIMPGEEATVELDLNGQVVYIDGEAEFRFPLVVAPRYIPGTPLPGEQVGDGVAPDTDRTPDASRISPPVLLPGFPNPVAFSLSVDIMKGKLPVLKPSCSLHAVAEEEGAEATRIRLYPGERLNRDFILRFDVGTDAVTSSAVLVDDEEGDEGTVMLTLVPPADLSKQSKPRDVVFVLDRSGSMGGWKMICARRALGRMVDTLSEKDRFTVLAFDNYIERPPTHVEGSLVQATDRNRFRTVEWIGGVDAEGGTEMARPLEESVAALTKSESGRDRIMVLVTDGQVGNEDEILRRLGDDLKSIRVFTLGIDRCVNEGFLQRMASVGGGYCELIESEDRLDDVMVRTHRRIATPVLTDIEFKLSGAHRVKETLTPRRLPDLFVGAPVMIGARYKKGDGPVSITITAKNGEEKWTSSYDTTKTTDQAVRRLWARWMIRDMEDDVAAGRYSGNMEERITKISLQHTVLCRYTAFVAVDKSEKVNEGGKNIEVTQPTDAPEGWDMFADEEIECLEESVTLSRSGMSMMQRKCSAPMPCSAPTPSPTAGGLSDVQGASSGIAKSKKLRSTSTRRPGALPPSKKERKQSVIGRIANFLSGAGEAKEEAPAESADAETPIVITNLADARAKAIELLERLQKAIESGTDALSKALWAAKAELEALADACEAHGAPDEICQPLRVLVDELEPLSSAPDSAMTVKLWKQLEEALRAIKDL